MLTLSFFELSGCLSILETIWTHSSLVRIPLAIGPLTNSRSFIRRYRTLKQTSSESTVLFFTGRGSTPCLLHSAAAHLSSAEKRMDSLVIFRVSRRANWAISWRLSSSKYSWCSTFAGFESITDRHLSRRSVHTVAAIWTNVNPNFILFKYWYQLFWYQSFHFYSSSRVFQPMYCKGTALQMCRENFRESKKKRKYIFKNK